MDVQRQPYASRSGPPDSQPSQGAGLAVQGGPSPSRPATPKAPLTASSAPHNLRSGGPGPTGYQGLCTSSGTPTPLPSAPSVGWSAPVRGLYGPRNPAP